MTTPDHPNTKDAEPDTLKMVNGSAAILVHALFSDTNAGVATLKFEELSYKGEVLGDFEIRIKRITNLTKERTE